MPVLWPCVRLSVSVRLSQFGVVTKWMNKLGWFLAWEFLLTHPTLKFDVPSKLRALPSSTLPQTLDLENFAAIGQSSECVIDSARQGGRPERDKLDVN